MKVKLGVLSAGVLFFIGQSAFAQEVVDTTGTQEIEEVVVTALGIKRKPKELSYSVSSLKSEDLTSGNSNDAAIGMIGKVSGMQINVVNNSVQPNTRVILRGNRSLLNNNEALIVVDGSPAPRGVLDRINPDDIAEMTILKGANASALYGSEAANGVVVITTKQGKGKLNVELRSAAELETIAYYPKLQKEFGAGGFPDGTIRSLENVAWGPRYDGSLVPASETYDNGDTWMLPYKVIPDTQEDFFRKPLSERNGLTISSGDDSSRILFSTDFLDRNGIVPKDRYKTRNLRLNATKKLGKFEFTGNFSFFHSQKNTVSDAAGRQGRPLMWYVINTPLFIPLTSMKNWRDGYYTRNEMSYFRFYENPYFLIDTERDKNRFNEFSFTGDIQYHATDWLNIMFRASYLSQNTVFKRTRDALTYAFEPSNPYGLIDPYGARTDDNMQAFTRFNSDFIVSIDKDLGDHFNIQANLGESVRIDDGSTLNVSAENLIIPGFYNISTRTGELTGTQAINKYRKVGAFADVTLGFNRWLFLNGSVRNDWSSSLTKDNRSFAYPGGGISVLLTEAIPSLVSPKGLSYLKVSGNITKSGNDPAAYVNQSIFAAPTGFPFGSIAGLSQGNADVSPDLKPEFTLSREVGLEFGFFRNRLTGNITAYQTNTTDQIIPVSSSYASGASSILTNLGELENKGIEVDLGGTIIKSSDFRWDMNLTYSLFKSKVLSLADGVDELTIGGYTSAFVVARVGESYPQIKTTSYVRDPQGRVVVGDNGDPLMDSELQVQGKTTPNYTVGLSSTLAYKGFALRVTADYRQGGVFYNQTTDALEFTGLTPHSVTSGRLPFVFPNSSYSDGNGGYIANTDRLTSNGGNAFWGTTYNQVKENYVMDASFVKIREISLSYSINKDFAHSLGLTNLGFAIYARNPFMFRPKDNVLTDPEFNYSTGNIIGVGDQRQTPSTRLFGLKVTANF